MLRLGVLDQSPVETGGTAVAAIRQTLELAQAAERWGYSRYWVSEHHDTPGLAGSSPEVLLAAIGAHTSRIRIGSAGVLLPHYSPYKVAENFRVLEALYPGRLDLGIGRAPGGIPLTAQALAYGRPMQREEQFAEQLRELGGFLRDQLAPEHPYAKLKATPLVETKPEIWLLGSSGFSAMRAAEQGGAFSFAHFINGSGGQGAVKDYLRDFRPGPLGDKPQVNVCVIVVCAETDEAAERLARPLDLRLLWLEQGRFGAALPTVEQAESYPYTEWDRLRIQANRSRMIVGGPDKVKARLTDFAAGYSAGEVIVVTMAVDFAARLRSYELLAEAFELNRA